MNELVEHDATLFATVESSITERRVSVKRWSKRVGRNKWVYSVTRGDD